MNKIWSDNAWEDYLYWQSHDRKTLKRIHDLLRDIERDPFRGKGKPESLKYEWQGYWSRRINDTDRLVYRVSNNMLEIAACRSHYGD
ncbi:MAG: Txe/YoeB family addiction module toxin [Oscillospiraceae bacterium]|jgi:toxin YoeB|nr:Txe/YoeB family addiction module toxin [Oscillospiraceae bacterium]